MSMFNTLLLREWLQYKRAWIGLVLVPMLLLLVLVPFSQVDGLEAVTPEPVTLISTLLTLGLVLAVALAVSGYQLIGLPRRDQQDRSIEFWASLPGSHATSLAAPLVAHGLLVPLAAAVIALAGGLVVGVAMAVKELGPEAVQQMQWSAVLQATLWFGLRLSVGLVLAALWLSPFVLALMAASAWLKRWGAPLLLIAVGAFLKLYENERVAAVVWGVLTQQLWGAARSVSPGTQSLVIKGSKDGAEMLERFYDGLYQFPQAAQADLVEVLGFTVQPPFFAGLIVAAGCFWLLVLQRRRGL